MFGSLASHAHVYRILRGRHRNNHEALDVRKGCLDQATHELGVHIGASRYAARAGEQYCLSHGCELTQATIVTAAAILSHPLEQPCRDVQATCTRMSSVSYTHLRAH